ncbi:MAG: Rieske 2Fe-2S domain-containing protein [Phycisphaeraceae bacterium]
MAETHQEVVKVWIAPGCIVCDACETDCPEVFDVQEENCVIRPEAQGPEFTKPLTPSIEVAAEGCPVDVIKFETIEVEGPAPWAGKEEEVAATAPAAAGAAASRKAGPAIPEGPPDPKWAGLLATSYTSGSRSAGGPAVRVRRAAKAPAEAIATALPASAPPDAVAAAMVGSGFARPMPTVAERIRMKAGALAGTVDMTRRQFALALTIAWGAMALIGGTVLAALQSFMVPKVTKEPPSIFGAGKISDFPDVGVYTQFKASNGVWIVHLAGGTLIALSDICTHLGCIPNWWPNDLKFKCPCHGSGFYMNGINFEGPAPRPLERFKIRLDGEFVVVDKSQTFREELGQWDNPDSYVTV